MFRRCCLYYKTLIFTNDWPSKTDLGSVWCQYGWLFLFNNTTKMKVNITYSVDNLLLRLVAHYFHVALSFSKTAPLPVMLYDRCLNVWH